MTASSRRLLISSPLGACDVPSPDPVYCECDACGHSVQDRFGALVDGLWLCFECQADIRFGERVIAHLRGL